MNQIGNRVILPTKLKYLFVSPKLVLLVINLQLLPCKKAQKIPSILALVSTQIHP